MTLDSKYLFACALFVPACVDTKLIGETTPGESTSTSDDAPSTETTAALPSTESSSSEPPDASSSSSSDGGSSDSTGGGVVVEWVGLYDSGFGNAYITPCGETDSVFIYASEIPGYEYCQATTGGNETEIWIRVRGMRVEGESGPEIHDVELLEGPCVVGGCEADATFDECTDFDSLCWPPEPLCDPYLQDCPNGMKCSVVASPEQFDCVQDGVVGDGDACVRTGGLDDCAEGLLCATKDLGSDGAGTCAELCADESHCSAPDTTCMLGRDGFGVCVPT